MTAPHLPGRRRDAATVIAGALVLLLAAGAVGALVLRHRDQRADARARRALAAAAVSVSAVGVASDHRVAVVLSVRTGTSARVVDASVTGDGWRAVHGRDVGLVREVDCTTAVTAPERAEALLELHGQRRRVELLTGVDLRDVLARTSREACGDVEARRALVLKASAAVRVPGGLQLGLLATNRSTHPVRLERVTVGGLHVRTSVPLPTVLAPRASYRAVVVVDPRGCGAAASVVGVDVSGEGGPAFLTVASADLPQQAAAVRSAHCVR